jgi:small-conductance mechanosensitive channel
MPGGALPGAMGRHNGAGEHAPPAAIPSPVINFIMVPMPTSSSPSTGPSPIAGLSHINLHAQIDTMTATGSAWIAAHWLQIVIAGGAAVAVYLLLNLAREGGIALCRRGSGQADGRLGAATDWRAVLGRAVARTGQWFIVLASLRLVVGYASAPPFVAVTIGTLFTIVATFQCMIWLRELVFGAIEHRTLGQEQEGLTSALGIIRVLLTCALFAVAVVIILNNVGVNVTGLVAGLGVGGIAIGLAAQGIFADLFAALAILFDRPFRVGDTISYDKGSGTGVVESIGLKSTRIRAGSGEERIIANRKLLDFEILNLSRRTHNRFRFDFVLDHATPPDTLAQIPALLQEAVEQEGFTLVHGGFNGFAPGGLGYDVEFQSALTDFPKQARDRVAAAILSRLAARDVALHIA